MEDDLDAFLARLDEELTRQFGPNHQEVLSTGGRLIAEFVWWEEDE